MKSLFSLLIFLLLPMLQTRPGGGGSSGGGGSTVAYTPQTIPFSATPAISTAVLQTITLTGNAVPTVTIVAGEHLVLQICQNGTGGWTWAPPASMHGAIPSATIAAMTPGTCAQQAFDSFNGTTLVAENLGVTNVAP